MRRRYVRAAYTAIFFIGVFLKQVYKSQITNANDFVWDEEDTRSGERRRRGGGGRSVYVVRKGGKLGVVDGAKILRWWQPDSSYDSLHLVTKAATRLPFAEESIIILHCFPKMASSSLRR